MAKLDPSVELLFLEHDILEFHNAFLAKELCLLGVISEDEYLDNLRMQADTLKLRYLQWEKKSKCV